ncbi:hypothetical protein [Pseudooceanicola sp.]|uniref:hypothetical protein n=1 Tax=Pseudooceanicola sp. TaxID=1914328 RepID=UPI003515D33D
MHNSMNRFERRRMEKAQKKVLGQVKAKPGAFIHSPAQERLWELMDGKEFDQPNLARLCALAAIEYNKDIPDFPGLPPALHCLNSIALSVIVADGLHEFFHGGTRGLKVGDFLLPRSITTINPRKEKTLESMPFVFFSQHRSEARAYAAQCDGDIYQVEPCGGFRIDTFCLWRVSVNYLKEGFDFQTTVRGTVKAFCAPSARIVAELLR